MHLDKDDLQKSTHHLAMKKKHNDLTLKARVDNLLNADLWANMQMKGGLSLQGSIGGNLKESGKGGFLCTPFNLGLKIKYSE